MLKKHFVFYLRFAGGGGGGGEVWGLPRIKREVPRVILQSIDSTTKIYFSHRTGLQKFGFAR